MPVRIYLIRHGETAWSISGQHTGRTDIALTARGEQQARRLADPLRDLLFTRVLSSSRQRAKHTCALAGFAAAARVEPDLAEWDYGNYEGLTSAEIHDLNAGWNIFRDGCPGGESPAQVSARADYMLENLRLLDGNVALFTHGHFGRVLATRWIGMPIAGARHFALSPASLSILDYDPHHPDVAVITQWNSTAHLIENNPDETSPAAARWENEGGGIPGTE